MLSMPTLLEKLRDANSSSNTAPEDDHIDAKPAPTSSHAILTKEYAHDDRCLSKYSAETVTRASGRDEVSKEAKHKQADKPDDSDEPKTLHQQVRI